MSYAILVGNSVWNRRKVCN